MSEEPPLKSHKNSFKLCLSRSGDLYSAIFGCGVSPQSRYNFGSLVGISQHRRDNLLEANTNNKEG